MDYITVTIPIPTTFISLLYPLVLLFVTYAGIYSDNKMVKDIVSVTLFIVVVIYYAMYS